MADETNDPFRRLREVCEPGYDGPGSVDPAAFDASLSGATNPSRAAGGTLRRLYGTGGPANVGHGSDSPEAFEREMLLLGLYPPHPIVAYINRLTFSFGLLLGLRHAGVTAFTSSGERFCIAFGALLDELKDSSAPRVEEYTWVANSEHRALLRALSNQMITDGMHGGLLTLDSPNYRKARMVISARAAKSEVRRYAPDDRPGWFEVLGRRFAEELREQGCAELPRHCSNCGHPIEE